MVPMKNNEITVNDNLYLSQVREARRLKEFLEDYDDERDDPKYYK